MKNIYISFIVIVILTFTKLYGGAGGTSLNFLKLDIGARASALSSAYSSYGENDSFSFYYNPALSLFVKSIDTSLSHSEYMLNLRNENINTVFKVNDSYSIGVGIFYMYANDFIHTIAAENIEGFSEVGKFGYYDLMAVLNSSFILSDKITGGINIKYIQEKIYIETGETILFDIGLRTYRKIFNVLNIGVSINNLGPPIKFVDKKENLPVILRFGISGGYSFLHLNQKNNDFNVSVDYVNSFEYDSKICIGAEVWGFDIVALRAGYSLNFTKSSLFDITLGIGVNYNMFEIGYAFVPFNYFGNTHKLSLNIRF